MEAERNYYKFACSDAHGMQHSARLQGKFSSTGRKEGGDPFGKSVN
ncbi:hypothetical protein NCCP2222_32120 [Sporosarcina sp. NCCP-2222]|nr:hypothetical protein NCCP2222_32120 [Sporosarcina sp. NCCP-2222]